MRTTIDLEFVRAWASVDGWNETLYQPNIGLIQFRKNQYGINIYLSKGTVAVWKGKMSQSFYKKRTNHNVADMLNEPSKYINRK